MPILFENYYYNWSDRQHLINYLIGLQQMNGHWAIVHIAQLFKTSWVFGLSSPHLYELKEVEARLFNQ